MMRLNFLKHFEQKVPIGLIFESGVWSISDWMFTSKMTSKIKIQFVISRFKQ